MGIMPGMETTGAIMELIENVSQGTGRTGVPIAVRKGNKHGVHLIINIDKDFRHKNRDNKGTSNISRGPKRNTISNGGYINKDNPNLCRAIRLDPRDNIYLIFNNNQDFNLNNQDNTTKRDHR